MRKIKNSLTSKKKPLDVVKRSGAKSAVVTDLNKKVKNLPENIKEESSPMSKGREIGSKSTLDIDDCLKKHK